MLCPIIALSKTCFVQNLLCPKIDVSKIWCAKIDVSKIWCAQNSPSPKLSHNRATFQGVWRGSVKNTFFLSLPLSHWITSHWGGGRNLPWPGAVHRGAEHWLVHGVDDGGDMPLLAIVITNIGGWLQAWIMYSRSDQTVGKEEIYSPRKSLKTLFSHMTKKEKISQTLFSHMTLERKSLKLYLIIWHKYNLSNSISGPFLVFIDFFYFRLKDFLISDWKIFLNKCYLAWAYKDECPYLKSHDSLTNWQL